MASEPSESDTCYFTVVDEDGLAVSAIQSIYYDFGSAVVAGDTGIVPQNRGSFFSLDPTHVNSLEPGKRPFHTLIPAGTAPRSAIDREPFERGRGWPPEVDLNPHGRLLTAVRPLRFRLLFRGIGRLDRYLIRQKRPVPEPFGVHPGPCAADGISHLRVPKPHVTVRTV